MSVPETAAPKNADFAERAKGLVQDQQFQGLPAERRLEVFKAFASKADPEGFGKLDEMAKMRAAGSIIGELNPGLMDTVKSAAKTVGGMIPVVGPASQAAMNPDAERPLTRQLVKALFSGSQASMGGFSGMQLPGAEGGPTDPLAASANFEQAVRSTAVGRFTAEATRDIAELVGGFKIASAAVKWGMGRFGLDKAGEMMARALGAGSADEAATLATQAARRKLVENVTERVATDLTMGEMMGVTHAIERGEVKPLEDLVVNPVMMAALGMTLMGGAAALKRFGPVRAQEAVAALEGQGPGGGDLGSVARDAQQFATALRRSSKLSKEESGELMYRVATGKADEAEAKLVRDLMLADPTLVKSEFGLHVTRMLRPVLETHLQVADGPLRLRFEDLKTRREQTVVVTNREELNDFNKRAAGGEIHIIEASGRVTDIAKFEAQPASRPSVVDGTETMDARHSEAASSVPTRSTNPMSTDVERHTAAPSQNRGVAVAEVETQGEWRASSPIDMMEREQMKSPFEAAPSLDAPSLKFEGPADVQRTMTGEVVPQGPPNRPRTSDRFSNVERTRGEPGDTPRRPSTNQRLGIVEERAPAPPPQTMVPVRGASDQAVVVSNADPRGVTTRLPTGDVMITKFGANGVEVPEWMAAAPERTSAAMPRPMLEAQTAAREMVGERPMTFTDPSGQLQRTTPDAQLGTVTVVDRVTGHAETVKPDVVQKAIAEGGLKVNELSTLSVEQLIERADALAAPRTGTNVDAMFKATQEHSRVVGELLNRLQAETIQAPAEASIARKMIEMIPKGDPTTFGVSFGGPISTGKAGRPVSTNLLPRQDPIAIQARAVNGLARNGENGSVVVDFTFGKQRMSVTYATKAEADAGLRSIAIGKIEQARIAEGGMRAVDRRKLAAPGEAMDPDAMAPQLRVATAFEYAPVSSVDRYTTGRPSSPFDIALPAIARLNRLGDAGREFAQRAQSVRELSDRYRGQALMEVEKALNGLSKEEVATAVTAYEKGTASPAVTKALDKLGEVGRQQLAMAKQIGLETGDEITERYAPHVFDVAQLRDKRVTASLIQEVIDKGMARNPEEALMVLDRQGIGTSRDMVIRNMVDRAAARGTKMTRAEAESVVDRFVSQNAQRISGNLERERLGVEGYVTDARRAYTVYFTRNARRLAEAQVFGPKDEHVLKLIDEVEAGSGHAASQYARQVYDTIVGRTREEMTGFWRELYNWQTAKLSLSVFANSSQSLNSAMRMGIGNTMKALFEVGADAAKHPVKFMAGKSAPAQHAREIGAVTMDILGDIRANGMTGMSEASSMLGRGFLAAKRGVEDVSTGLFQLVETGVNRSVAVRAGERYFMQQVEGVVAGNARAIRRMQEIGFKSDAIKAMSRDDLTEAMYLAGQRLSNSTQFKADALSTPLWAQSPMGRFVYQFKSFSVNQARFMWEEIAGGHGDLSRRLRALGILTTAYPAVGVGLTKLRSGLMGDSVASETIDEALKDPSVSHLLMAGVAGLATSGALGIIGDVALTQAMSGSKFTLMATMISPMASSALNAFEVGRSVAQGIAQGDSLKYQSAARTALREFGGVGATVSKVALGEPEKGGGSSGGFGRGGGFGSSKFGR